MSEPWTIDVEPGGNGKLVGANQDRTIKGSASGVRKFKLNRKGVKIGKMNIYKVWSNEINVKREGQ